MSMRESVFILQLWSGVSFSQNSWEENVISPKYKYITCGETMTRRYYPPSPKKVSKY